MSLRYLLDTNICIYIRDRRPPEVRERFARLTPGAVGMSVVTYGELVYGALKSVRRAETLAKIQRLAALVPVMTPASGAGARYGEIRYVLERSGMPIGNNDLWIAAHALELRVTLVTNNIKEFARVPGLLLENWAEPAEQGPS